MTDTLLGGADQLPTEPKNFYEELVGENKKFKDNEALAKGKWESDSYVKILERRLDSHVEEIKALREETNTGAQLKDLLNQMKSQREEQLASSNNTTANEATQSSIKPEDIESLVSAKIQEHDLTKRQTDNFNTVRDKLQQRYGNNYKEAVKQQIDELGITEQELNEMARKNPKVIIRTLGLDQQVQQDSFQSPPRSQSTQTSFAPSGPTKRTWTYYQELKKKNPDAWLDRKTAIQMQQDALELGEAFRDGDYYVPGLHERNQ